MNPAPTIAPRTATMALRGPDKRSFQISFICGGLSTRIASPWPPPSVRRLASLKSQGIKVIQHLAARWTGGVHYSAIENALLRPNQRASIALGPLPFRSRKQRFTLRVFQFMFIPINARPYWVSDIGIGEFAQNPSMREHSREYGAVRDAPRSHRHIQCPPVAQKAAIVDARAFGAEEAFGFVLIVLGDFGAFANHEVAAIQPEFPVRSEQSSALPAVAFPEECDRMEPG